MNTLSRVIIVCAIGATPLLRAADASATWKDHCAKCHGLDGRGDTKQGRKLNISDFSDAAFQAKFTDQEAFDAVKSGLKSAKGKVIMKATTGLSDDEIRAVVAHLRTLKK